jgi:S-adenosylmethionine:tRNA ribosyltransferase-isomerase
MQVAPKNPPIRQSANQLILSLPQRQSVALPMHPRSIRIADYTYDLPVDRIALFPAPERDGSRLLIPTTSGYSEDIYRHIADHIPTDALVVFNRTRVVEARLVFQKPTGGRIEVFALEHGDEYPDVTTAMSTTGSVRWKCLVGGAAKWKHGQVPTLKFSTPEGEAEMRASIQERLSDSFLIELTWTPSSLSFAEVLHHAGRVPLPPYIKREVRASDAERYQTVFARDEGSVAAPTAGLHFTPAVLDAMKAKGIRKAWLTLHVGAGTFKPVQADTMEGHDMHAEGCRHRYHPHYRSTPRPGVCRRHHRTAQPGDIILDGKEMRLQQEHGSAQHITLAMGAV